MPLTVASVGAGGQGGSSSSAAGSGGAKAGAGGSSGTGFRLLAAGSDAAGASAAGSSAAGSSAAGSGAAGAAAGAGAVHGTATFTKTAIGVDVALEITGCTDGKSYPVHIHQGTSCDSTATQGGHWGALTGAAGSSAAGAAAAGAGGGAAGTSSTAAVGGSGGTAAGGAGAGGTSTSILRGEGIPDMICKGGSGMTTLSRSAADASLAWTIGGAEESNVVGHVVVVHEGSARVACGKIQMQ
jgi:hypothetical protein